MRWLLTFLLVFNAACSSLDDIDTSTPAGAFELAERYAKAERFEEAISRFGEVRTKFPYSKYAVEAQLRIADIEFDREYYVEAASAYQIFREMNPRYKRLEYVIYRIAKSFYLQLPEIDARDLSAAEKALEYFSEYLEKYPDGTWAKELRGYQNKTYVKLANKEMYIGDFYYKQEKYLSALGRYQAIAINFSFLEQAKTAALKAMHSAIKIDKLDIAQEYVDFLKRKFPDSEELQQALEQGAYYGLL
tara:strand:+ start:11862 stop:12602 length:741 start_codon:yes stop_codon:yes gene_type:complete